MATIAATATALPVHELPQEEAIQAMADVFPMEDARREAITAIFANAGVRKRYTVMPLRDLIQPRGLDETSKAYSEAAIALGRQVAEDALKRAKLAPQDIDYLITVSCTGVMIPSLDAYLINALGMRPQTKRLPITELGCAAGASALSRARDYVQAFPNAKVLIVAVELPSLTFQRRDMSMPNMVSCAIFGDGAAAAVVTGDTGVGPRIVDTQSYLFPDSIDAMGFDLKDGGLHIVLSKDVPDLVRSRIKALIGGFLGPHGVAPEQLKAFMLHPGGKKILHYLEAELGLTASDTRNSWHVLENFGNMSSASILFVLENLLAEPSRKAGDYGLMAAFGPGFSAEMLLLQWGEAA
jgi:alkylresorcinol/alkylpyrone synthase